uniref:DUF4378 domain-containing protein n=1 Tax=Leersia perrieri TaxID=77586 RepID=A0A0D9XLR2_9ORYZ
MATMAGGSKPLRLKDLLELDCESCSAAGFRCYPRRLCVVAAGAAAATAAATTVSSSSSQMRHPRLSSLSKSLSRRLKGGFWRRHDEEEEAAAAPASSIAAAAGCCSISDSETSSDSSNSTTGRKSHSQSESEFSSASSDILHAGDGEPSTTGAKHEVMKMKSKEEEDDKEQFSPVGVMDFPFDEDDDDAIVIGEEDRVAAGVCTPSFSDSIAQLQRRKMQMKPKILRLGSTGELGGVDLEARFAALESDRLTDVVPTQHQCSANTTALPRHDDHRSDDAFKKDPDEYTLLDLLVDTVSAVVAETERSRRWMHTSEEGREIGVVMAAMVMDELIHEMVSDLVA